MAAAITSSPRRSSRLRAIAAVTGLLAATVLLTPTASASAATPGGSSETIASGTVVTVTGGTITGKLVPLSSIRPNNATGDDGAVSFYVTGTGLHVDDWEIVGDPLPPGLCTQSFYEIQGIVREQGPFLCNGASYDSIYVSNYDNFSITGNAQACSTVAHLVGKPCFDIHS